MRVSCLWPRLEKPQHENLRCVPCSMQGRLCHGGISVAGRVAGGGAEAAEAWERHGRPRVCPSSPQSGRDSPKVTKRVRKKQSVPGAGPNKQNPIKKKKMTLGT